MHQRLLRSLRWRLLRRHVAAALQLPATRRSLKHAHRHRAHRRARQQERRLVSLQVDRAPARQVPRPTKLPRETSCAARPAPPIARALRQFQTGPTSPSEPLRRRRRGGAARPYPPPVERAARLASLPPGRLPPHQRPGLPLRQPHCERRRRGAAPVKAPQRRPRYPLRPRRGLLLLLGQQPARSRRPLPLRLA